MISNKFNPLLHRQLAFTGVIGSGGGGGGGSDIKVKVSANDTTTDYLSAKLASSDGSGTFSIVNPSGNEQFDLSVTNYETITYTNLLVKIGLGELVPNRMYQITGFNKNMPVGSPENPDGYLPVVLYDDGTDSGITIYMVAQTPTEMADSGWGEFYNPKYIDGNSYYNTDGTGLYGIWDGNNPNPANVPAYVVGQVVFWGGYAWENVSGNVGNALDVLTLSADWTKLPYSNATYYEMVIDEIKVDWLNGILVERYNAANQIRVAFNAPEYSWWMGIYNSIQCNPISGMGWGIYSKVTQGVDGDYYGITNVESIDSQCETVNFKGIGFFNNYLNDSYLENNYFGMGVYFIFYSSNNYGTFSGNTITSGSYLEGNINNGGYIGYNSFINNCTISYSILNNGSIQNNQFDFVKFQYNTLNVGGQINTNIASSNSEILYNTLDNNGEINNNNLSNVCYISRNTLDRFGKISQNTMVNNCVIEGNIIIASEIGGNTLNTNGNIISNILNGPQARINVNIITLGGIRRNTLGYNCFIQLNNINTGYIDDNTLNQTSSINNNSLPNYQTITKNVIDNSSIIDNTGVAIESNNLMMLSSIGQNNAVSSTGFIAYNDLFNSYIINNSGDGFYIYNNKLTQESNIQYNTSLDVVNILHNSLSQSSNIDYNQINFGSKISYNSLDSLSNISSNNLDNNSEISKNQLVNSTFNFSASGALSGKIITKIIASYSSINSDISLATIIFYNTQKTIFTRYDNTIRMSYYDTTDTPIIVNVNA